jgi:hypothetical protein
MNVRIDFNKIRGDMPEGQRGAFEELVCQLARRQAPDPKSFRRIEGAGGDSGVECIHRATGGGIVGYQAKYYTSGGEIDWRAIHHSWNTALATYPELVTYVIAIACDFTGRRRVRGGKIGDGTWGKWDSRVEKWQVEATNKGRSVEIIPWTADEIGALLTSIDAAGLRAYWFDQTQFTHSRFGTQVELAVAALDERYNPEDHVDVRIQSLFDFIVRHPKAIQRFKECFEAIRKLSFPEHRLRNSERKPSDELIKGSVDTLQTLMASESKLMLPIADPWPVENWKQLTNNAARKVQELQRWAWDAETGLKGPENETARRDVTVVLSDLSTLYSELQSLDHLLRGRYLIAEKKRAALLAGRAGTGKSHLLARVAELAVSENRPVVLIVGQQLREQALWPQIIERLGLRDVSAAEFLGALDSAAEAARVRGLILVDAINEGPGARLWRDEIASFLKQIKGYPNLACVLSCRSEYVEYLVPQAVLEALPRFEVRGFETAEEQAQAARAYLDKRGISRPATPWVAPEFINPLFLRSCCNALQQENKTEFPRGLTGTKEIFGFFLNSVACHLAAGRDGTNELVGPTKVTLHAIAVQMAEAGRTIWLANARRRLQKRVLSYFSRQPV